MAIKEFRGKYFFLSNYYTCNVKIEGISYTNTESAFQSMKTNNMNIRKSFSTLNPSKAKSKGRKVQLREDWEDVKDDIMYKVVSEKFKQNNDLRLKLISTGDEELIEGNDWNDTYWGVSHGKGRNMLGKILMKVRDELKYADYKNLDYENHIS